MNTPAQSAAIDARGDVLVVAGAGAGKTRTLVERCLAWLLEDPVNHSLDQVLMVTFTEAAGAEMRKRLRDRMAGFVNQEVGKAQDSPWPEQLALLETAHICTLHSFCLRLVRQHFHELGLDPQVAVLAEEQTRLLERSALDQILDENYRGETAIAATVQDFIQDHGRGWDQPVRELVTRIHAYTQTLPDPKGWFEQQFAHFQSPEPTVWLQWLLDELAKWQQGWLPILNELASQNPNAAQCAKALAALPEQPTRETYAVALGAVIAADAEWPPRQKIRLRAPLEKLLAEAGFLHSICAVSSADPLSEDWNWLRPQMQALLTLARQFEQAFSLAKRELGGIDFHDLEQFALQLLRDKKTGLPTAVAEHWRKKFQLIFVDEYQDINAAQDAIICALGGEGPAANRFLVGDVKQSIYRFRLADPRIFLDYQRRWKVPSPESSSRPSAVGGGKVIALSENFRSHEGILNFVNALCSAVMKPEVGGIAYDEAAHLRFGNREGRAPFAIQPGEAPRVELHLRLPSKDDVEEQGGEESLSEIEKEARLLGKRLLELKQAPTLVHDSKGSRPVTWTDMVILLRSPRKKVEAYVKEFSRLGIPLEAARGGFYESLEIRDLFSLLQVLDNPLQDYPLLAVLRSPLVGLTPDDLAAIRIANRRDPIWTALLCWHETQQSNAASAEQNGRDPRLLVSTFLARYRAWRRSARHLSISQCLESVLDETHYSEWLLTQERGEQRSANVGRMLQLTRQFDVFQREGLYRFLKYVEAQQEQEIEVEPAATPMAEAVRLMSVHQSKGLEFPIVALPDLAKPFNFGDTRGKIILDEELGLCSQIKPPQAHQFYPSLPFWMAQRRQKVETLGEELRLLYVALTRAAERLVLVGTASSAKSMERWERAAQRGCGITELLAAKSCLDWIGPWLSQTNGGAKLASSGANSLLTWTVHEGTAAEPLRAPGEAPVIAPRSPERLPALALEQLQARLAWSYPSEAATHRPAKTSVSALRRAIADEEAAPAFGTPRTFRTAVKRAGKLSAAEVGTAHHAFLELVSLDRVHSVSQLREESLRMRAEESLKAEQADCLDFNALAAFWQSEAGQACLSHVKEIRRELAFTARFAIDDVTGPLDQGVLSDGEFVVVQGVIDLAVVLPCEIWLLDFKTDQVAAAEVGGKVKAYQPQLELYAQAIGRIYKRPVTRAWLHFLALGETVSVSCRPAKRLLS